MTSMLQRIAAAAACALLFACPASAQLIGSGHVMGNGTASPAAPTDTQLLGVMNQSGSGFSFGGTTRKLSTESGAIANGHCRSTDSSGNVVDAGGPCTTSGGGGTVNAGTTPQFSYYASTGPAVSGMALTNPLLGPNVNNVVAYGADPTGVTDSSAAFNAAVTAALAGATGGGVVIPCGRYKLDTAQVAATIPVHKGLSFFGGGSDCTTLYTTAGSPLALVLADPVSSHFHIRGFTLTTKAANTGTAIAISSTVLALQQLGFGNDISDVTFSGDDATSGASPFHLDYFATDIAISGGVSNINFININDPGDGAVAGIGVSLFGDTANSNFGLGYNFINPNFNYKGLPIEIGNWIQGVEITNPDIVGGVNGIVINGSLGGFFGLSVSGGNFACVSACIASTVPVTNMSISGVASFVPLSASTALISGQFISSSITGSAFINPSHPGAVAIVTTNGSNGVVITGNSFTGSFNVAALFQATSSNINLQSNVYNGPTFKSSPSATSGSIVIGTGSP